MPITYKFVRGRVGAAVDLQIVGKGEWLEVQISVVLMIGVVMSKAREDCAIKRFGLSVRLEGVSRPCFVLIT